MTVIQRAQLLLLKAITLAVRALPRRTAVRAGRIFGLLSGMFIPLHREIARIQMRHVLGPKFEEKLLRESFMHQGGLFADMVRVAYMDDRELKDNIVVEGGELFEAALASGRSLMIVSGHMNWEILGHIPRVFGIKVCVMADYIKNPAIQAMADEMRSRCRIDVLPPKGGMVNRLIGELKAGSIVGMVIDQRGKRENRLFCDVLGLPAPTNPAPAFIALKGDALVLPIACFRQGDGYIFRWAQPIDSRSFGNDCQKLESLAESFRSDAVRGLSCAIQSWVSSVVREHPEQWFWLHCRWLRRSDMKMISRKGLDFGEFVRSHAHDYLRDDSVI
jgi:Kdo2-lipid IVA lauroyltransferase/acyltransferase